MIYAIPSSFTLFSSLDVYTTSKLFVTAIDFLGFSLYELSIWDSLLLKYLSIESSVFYQFKNIMTSIFYVCLTTSIRFVWTYFKKGFFIPGDLAITPLSRNAVELTFVGWFRNISIRLVWNLSLFLCETIVVSSNRLLQSL